MADFKTAYSIVMTNEGGWVRNPNDEGKETYKGISRRSFPIWMGWITIDAAKSKPNFPASLSSIPELQVSVTSFYKENFWNRLNLDLVANQKIANELFDTGVNMGTGVAGLFLQRVLNVSNRNGADYPDISLDGIVGHRTIDVLNNHKRPNDILKALNCLQGAKYIAICENNPSQEVFFRSWFSRVFE